MKMSELSRCNAVLKDSLLNKISTHRSEHERPFSSPVPFGKELRSLRWPKSPRSDSRACSAELDIKTMETLECDLLKKLVAVTKRKEMSESDYNRRRDELNRLLEKDELETREIEKERDQAIKDLKNVESAFADVQEKYERVMKTVLTLKEKEQLLIERDHENMLKVKEMDESLEKFKVEAYRHVDGEYRGWLSKLAEAEGTNVKLKAMIRKAEMKIEKLEHELGQKQKENSELHNLCDELIHNSSRSPE
ncbi:Transforming acidic coiled-coil-containing protein 2 [Orchesella cincta]|uniref:Transforming acidic coiled-coil-containing protein 2 n=1 Tax=Orchesella cincta TaxID=48709 RepID=A0A1D2MJL8_ORCCI|nr:Transforming acidic coiled-coil-containing protein 2 [Orchesella cincta]